MSEPTSEIRSYLPDQRGRKQCGEERVLIVRESLQESTRTIFEESRKRHLRGADTTSRKAIEPSRLLFHHRINVSDVGRELVELVARLPTRDCRVTAFVHSTRHVCAHDPLDRLLRLPPNLAANTSEQNLPTFPKDLLPDRTEERESDDLLYSEVTLKLSMSDSRDLLCILARSNVASSPEPKLVRTIVCSSSMSSVAGGHS